MKITSFTFFIQAQFILTARLAYTYAELNFGDPACPCLEDLSPLNLPKINETCLDVRIASSFDQYATPHCYPLTYGTSCEAHDKGLAPFCNTEDPPSFCNVPFCYIDPFKCSASLNNTFKQSSMFKRLYYSYSTCGEPDLWAKFEVSKKLEGATLRVGVPNLFFPDHYRMDESGFPILSAASIQTGKGDLVGLYIDLLQHISQKGGFKVHYMDVSPGALAQNGGNGWSGCAYDVGRGVLDMCVGNFWETPERRQLVQFSTTMFNDVFYMRVPHPQVDHNLGVQMTKLLQPFTPSLWITIIVVTIVVGFSYTILSPSRNGSWRGFAGKLIGYIYAATMELLQGAGSEDDHFARKSVSCSWALFILISVAAYTANLAAFMGDTKLFFPIQSVEDCMIKKCRICASASSVLASQLKKKFPLLNLDLGLNTIADLVAALEDGTCQAAVVSEFDYHLNPAYWGNCETQFLGNFVTDFKVAWPVRLAVSETITYWMGETVESGLWDEVVHQYRPHSPCVEPVVRQDNQVPVAQISVPSFAGPLVVLGVGIAFGLFYNFGHNAIKKKKDDSEDETISA